MSISIRADEIMNFFILLNIKCVESQRLPQFNSLVSFHLRITGVRRHLQPGFFRFHLSEMFPYCVEISSES